MVLEGRALVQGNIGLVYSLKGELEQAASRRWNEDGIVAEREELSKGVVDGLQLCCEWLRSLALR